MEPKVASISSDFGSDEDVVGELVSNPHSYLHVTKLPLIHPSRWEHPRAFIPHARAFIEKMLEEGALVQDDAESFYVYRQTINGESHTGLIGLCDMVDYRENHIKRHEFTRHERESFISDLIEQTSVIGEPLLLSHHHRQSLEDLLRSIILTSADLEFEVGGRFHQIWQVSDSERLQHIQHEMREIQDMYIMDGHHRIASVNKLYESRKLESYRYALSFVLDANQLSIAPFHRLIKMIPMDHSKLLNDLSEEFDIQATGAYVIHPAHQRSFILKTALGTYELNARKSWGGLDVDLFEEKIVQRIFGISDSRTDQRIEFLAGDEPINDALEMLAGNDCFLFLLHPCTFREIAMTSDAHKVLPPKSTFVEPKCSAGLFVQSYGSKPLI